jgi:hypothetical protein
MCEEEEEEEEDEQPKTSLRNQELFQGYGIYHQLRHGPWRARTSRSRLRLTRRAELDGTTTPAAKENA